MPALPDPLPWPEIVDLVDGAALVFGSDADPAGLPEGWTALQQAAQGDAGDAGAVVVLDPVVPATLVEAAAVAGQRPLIVVTSNVGRPAYIRALMSGRGDELLPGQGRMSRRALDDALAPTGRVPSSSPPQPALVTGRPLDDLVAGVVADAGGHDRPWLVRRYDAVPGQECPAGPTPFLSVLVRTQGRRPEALAEVLLCLAAQTCPDMEVLLLAHDVDTRRRTVLDQQVAELPSRLRDRTRVVKVTGGGRSRPLTVGVAAAVGDYLAVLDDDDLVLGHWVDTFHAAAEEAAGRILRAIAVDQHVDRVPDQVGYRAASWPQARWDARFSLLSHVVDNHSPIHSYAYPREVFHGLGLTFDESLPVLEDWDLLVRAASLVGVHDTGEVTAVYRRWPADASSFAEVPEDGWPDTAWKVVAGWDRRPFLLPAGSATRLRHEGIDTLLRRPLRQRLEHRLRLLRDRWAPRLMRTPLGPVLRLLYRRSVRPAEPAP